MNIDFLKVHGEIWDIAQLVGCSTPESHKPGLTGRTCNSSIRGMETGWSRVQDQCCLRSEFEASLGYMRLCLIKNKTGGVIVTWRQATLLFDTINEHRHSPWGWTHCYSTMLHILHTPEFIEIHWDERSFFSWFLLFFPQSHKRRCFALETSFHVWVTLSCNSSWWGNLGFSFVTLLKLQCCAVSKTVLHLGVSNSQHKWPKYKLLNHTKSLGLF